MDGIKIKQGFIVMEELEELSPDIARSLFAALGDSEKNKKARVLRDKRLLKNPKLVSSLLNIAWNMMGRESEYLSMDAQFAAEKRIMEQFFSGNLPTIRPDPHIKKMAMSDLGKKLMMLYIQITYEEMLNHPENEEHKGIIEQYEHHMKQTLLNAFNKAYQKPLVSGAEGKELSQMSALRGMDQFFGQEGELEQEFPEIMFVRDAMKKFASREFKPFDVHSGNVMMRPKTNDIVIVDLGRFNT